MRCGAVEMKQRVWAVGVRRALLGSVAESLVRTADRPVLVVREGQGACAAVL